MTGRRHKRVGATGGTGDRAYGVTVYRDDPDEASAVIWFVGHYPTREMAEQTARLQILDRGAKGGNPAGSHFSATVDQGWIEIRRVGSLMLRDFVDDPDGPQWAMGYADGEWWGDQYQ